MKPGKMNLLMIVLIFSSCSLLQKNRKNNSIAIVNHSRIKTDTSKKAVTDTSKRTLPKPYNEVITAKAVSDPGLFTVHKIEERYYFEIADSLLGKDWLIVSRIAKGGANLRPQGVGYSGDEINQRVVRWNKGRNYKLLLQSVSYTERSYDSSQNGMYLSVRQSNLLPILSSFDIKTFGPDSATVVIDVTDFINSDNSVIYFDPSIKKSYGFSGWHKDRSFIESIQSFPMNVELQSINTYTVADATATIGLNTSFVLLPKEPMIPRYFDERVGYFREGYIDYDSPQGVDITWMIARWRLEPKEADKEKYLQGELVEPKKPIVYYIDPATPKKWVPYMIQGVNDWQKAFEKAGFKNAIYALQAPADDSMFSLLDARHNAIIYKSSTIQNASGPNVHDPRTGEILETHINWYHNMQQLLHAWYMIQAGPNDQAARKMVFDDSLMGQLIRFVACHEVGHTLGLTHNFGASSTVPTDSLRSKSYLEKNGFCPSIMDYARFNYVAQPEDRLTQKELFPRIGEYDEWAIEWGYRWFPQLNTKKAENDYMNKWITSKLDKNKMLWYGSQQLDESDPRCQAEDLGDDAVKSGYYGLQNLKRVMQALKEWCTEPNKDYEPLKLMYQQVVNQAFRYYKHVANNIGNHTTTYKKANQKGNVIRFIPKEKQRDAVAFLNKELFETPGWLYNKDIFSLIGGAGPYQILFLQKQIMGWIINFTNYNEFYFSEAQQPKSAYSFAEFLSDLYKGIWKELKQHSPIDQYRRNLQKVYIEQLIESGIPNSNSPPDVLAWKYRTDCFMVFQNHMRRILSDIDQALPFYRNGLTKMHLQFIKNRLQQALDYNPFLTIPSVPKPASNKNGLIGTEAKELNDVGPEILPKKDVIDRVQLSNPFLDCDLINYSKRNYSTKNY